MGKAILTLFCTGLFSSPLLENTVNPPDACMPDYSQIENSNQQKRSGLCELMALINEVHLRTHKAQLSHDMEDTHVTEARMTEIFMSHDSGWSCGAHLLLFHLGCPLMLVVAMDDDWFPEYLEVNDAECDLRKQVFSGNQIILADTCLEPLAPPPDQHIITGKS